MMQSASQIGLPINKLKNMKSISFEGICKSVYTWISVYRWIFVYVHFWNEFLSTNEFSYTHEYASTHEFSTTTEFWSTHEYSYTHEILSTITISTVSHTYTSKQPRASAGGAGAKPLLGSANTVQCHVRLG